MTFFNGEVLCTLVEKRPTCIPGEEQYQDNRRAIERPWNWSVESHCGINVDHSDLAYWASGPQIWSDVVTMRCMEKSLIHSLNLLVLIPGCGDSVCNPAYSRLPLVWCLIIPMGDWDSPTHLTYKSVNCVRQGTWTRCEHTNHIKKDIKPGIKSKFFSLWDGNIKNSTAKPPSTEKLLYNLYYCKRPHFILFHFYWHRRTDIDVHPQGSSCSFATCSFTLNLLLPKGHGHIKCCHNALQTGQRLEGSRTTEPAYDLITTLESASTCIIFPQL